LQSLRMSQCVGMTGKVYAFEPLIYLQEKLSKNLSLNCAANVTLFPYALSDEEAETDFQINSKLWNQGTFSLGGAGGGSETQKVHVKIADKMLEIQRLTSISLIKIDVEGFEYHVLRGLTEALKKHRPRIIFEYDSNYWVKTGQNMAECFSFLIGLNYTCYQVTPVGCERIKSAEQALSGNIFCIQV